MIYTIRFRQETETYQFTPSSAGRRNTNSIQHVATGVGYTISSFLLMKRNDNRRGPQETGEIEVLLNGNWMSVMILRATTGVTFGLKSLEDFFIVYNTIVNLQTLSQALQNQVLAQQNQVQVLQNQVVDLTNRNNVLRIENDNMKQSDSDEDSEDSNSED